MLTLAAYAILAILLLAPGLLVGPSLDAAVFTLIGSRLTDGASLYVDAWDHKPPGIYLLNAGGQALLGWLDPWLVSWLIGLAATVGLGYAVCSLVERVGVDRWPARLAGSAAILVAAQYLFALGGGLTEPVASALAAASLLLAVGPRIGLARSVGIGLLLSSAVLVSLQLALGAAVIFVLAVTLALPGARWRTAAGILLGAVLPVAAVGAWLASSGSLGSALDAVIGYAAAYRGANAGSGASLSSPVAAWSLLALIFLLLPAGLGALGSFRVRGRQRVVAIGALAWLALSLVAFVIQGRFIAHYAIPLAIPLAILAGMGVKRVAEAGQPMLALPLLVGLAASVAAGAIAGTMEWQTLHAQQRRVQAVADQLRRMTAAGDTILVWGNVPQLYLAADRRPATPDTFLYPLTTHGYSTAAQVSETLARLVADPPAAVVDAGSDAPAAPGFLPLLVPRPVATDGRDLDLLGPLRAFVADRYRLADEVDGWLVYVPAS